MLRNDYEDFESLENVGKSSYVLGSKLCERKFDGMLGFVKEYIVDEWKIRKQKLYDSNSESSLQLHSQSSFAEMNDKFIQNSKFGQNGKVYIGFNISNSTHNCGYMVNGGNAMAVI